MNLFIIYTNIQNYKSCKGQEELLVIMKLLMISLMWRISLLPTRNSNPSNENSDYVQILNCIRMIKYQFKISFTVINNLNMLFANYYRKLNYIYAK